MNHALDNLESLITNHRWAGAGDVVLMFTDGVTDAMNAAGDPFGEERLAALVAEHGELPFEELRERILREIRAFAGETGLQDDLTFVLLKMDEMGAPAPAHL